MKSCRFGEDTRSSFLGNAKDVTFYRMEMHQPDLLPSTSSVNILLEVLGVRVVVDIFVDDIIFYGFDVCAF